MQSEHRRRIEGLDALPAQKRSACGKFFRDRGRFLITAPATGRFAGDSSSVFTIAPIFRRARVTFPPSLSSSPPTSPMNASSRAKSSKTFQKTRHYKVF
jgi:hypothetical protein